MSIAKLIASLPPFPHETDLGPLDEPTVDAEDGFIEWSECLYLEPEEARGFARRLLELADEGDRIQRASREEARPKRFESRESLRRYGGIRIIVSPSVEPTTAETVRIPCETLAECAAAWQVARAEGAVL